MLCLNKEELLQNINLDELIEKNDQQKKKEISDKIQDFGEIPLFTEPLVIYGEFEHEVVLQLKGNNTQEDTTDSVNHITIYGVSVSFETHPPQMIPMTEEYFRDDLEPRSGIRTCAYGNFLEDQEDFDNLVEVIRGIRGSSVH
jgi:hypothetical protein